jgi:hypothetical protein
MDAALRDELLGMMAEDQAARRRLLRHPRPATGGPARAPTGEEREDLERAREIDARNTARMRAIVRARGWPGRSMVGEDGAHAAWLLVQHADADPAFQRTCLGLLGEAVRAGEAGAADHAYLTDRVLLAEGRPQRYGTQFTFAGGAWRPSPLADPDRVDERRREVGLPSLDDYRRAFEDPEAGDSPQPRVGRRR